MRNYISSYRWYWAVSKSRYIKITGNNTLVVLQNTKGFQRFKTKLIATKVSCKINKSNIDITWLRKWCLPKMYVCRWSIENYRASHLSTLISYEETALCYRHHRYEINNNYFLHDQEITIAPPVIFQFTAAPVMSTLM